MKAGLSAWPGSCQVFFKIIFRHRRRGTSWFLSVADGWRSRCRKLNFRYHVAVKMNKADAPLPAQAAAEAARSIRDALPPGGLFAGLEWRISPVPFPLGENLVKEIESLGRVLLQFYRAVNLLYRKSAEGKQPEWIARWLDLGKPAELIALQRSAAFKNDVPRVIRPDLLLTEQGISITELDSVPGGIGLTAWLNQTYANVAQASRLPGAASTTSETSRDRRDACATLIGGADGMVRGFESIFGDAKTVHIVVSEEAATYRPEMEWLAGQIQGSRFKVQGSRFKAQGSRAKFSDQGGGKRWTRE